MPKGIMCAGNKKRFVLVVGALVNINGIWAVARITPTNANRLHQFSKLK